jgi:hypothetical protein
MKKKCIQYCKANKANKANKLDNESDKNNKNNKSLRKQIDNINYCSNPVYKTIVFTILLGILIYFIWFVTRKKYNDDTGTTASTPSTPFNVPGTTATATPTPTPLNAN